MHYYLSTFAPMLRVFLCFHQFDLGKFFSSHPTLLTINLFPLISMCDSSSNIELVSALQHESSFAISRQKCCIKIFGIKIVCIKMINVKIFFFVVLASILQLTAASKFLKLSTNEKEHKTQSQCHIQFFAMLK